MSWDQSAERPRRRWRSINLTGPLILITLGLVFLMANLGLLSTNPWQLLWQWWPLILIVLGLEIFIGVLGRWSYALSAILAVLVVVGTVALVGYLLFAHPQFATPAPAFAGRLSQPLGGASQAEVNLDFSLGTLRVSALPAGSSNLVEVEFTGPSGTGADNPSVRRDYQETGGVGVLTLKSESPRVSFGGSNWPEWALRLSPDVPLTLNLDAVMGTYDLNLRDLRVANLELKGVMCTQQVQLPAKGQTVVHVKGVMDSVEITVPAGVAARIQRKGLVAMQVDEGRFPRSGDIYQSNDYSTATDRVDIVIESVMAATRVR